MKLAIVVQRFAPDVTGGAEYHARRVAEHLAARGHEVTILTSTSRDARRWRDHYPAGESLDGALRVLRFPVKSRMIRNLARAKESLLRLVGRSPVTLAQAWSYWANPFVPAMMEHLDAHGADYAAVFFFTYFYYPSLVGPLHVRGAKRVGVPLGHDDFFFSTPVVARMLRALDAIVCNTDEERTLVERVRGDAPAVPYYVAGCGVDPPPAHIGSRPIDAPYVLYLGRAKPGTELLHEAWSIFRARYGNETFESDRGCVKGRELVFAAVGDRTIGEAEAFRVFDHVEPAARWAFTAHAEAIVNPSLYESLSLTLLEGWWVRRPAIVRVQCDVMRAQVERAQAGVTFGDARGLADAMAELLRSHERRTAMGKRGEEYATTRYSWDAVMRHYDEVLATVGG